MDETMGNQQATLAWLAGIWDGEGHISIRRSLLTKTRGPQYSPRVGVTNSNTQILTRIRQILDEYGIKYYFREKGQGGFEGSHKQCWVISLDTLTEAEKLLTLIRPYLVGKTFQADCLMEFIDRRQTVRRKENKVKKYKERDFHLVRQIVEANGDIKGASETIRQDAQRAMI